MFPGPLAGLLDPSVLTRTFEKLVKQAGFVVSVGRLVGVYSSPHRITEYRDGNRRQGLTVSFETKRTDGDLRITDETTEVGYFSPEQTRTMDVMEPVYEMVADAFAGQEAPFVS